MYVYIFIYTEREREREKEREKEKEKEKEKEREEWVPKFPGSTVQTFNFLRIGGLDLCFGGEGRVYRLPPTRNQGFKLLSRQSKPAAKG